MGSFSKEDWIEERKKEQQEAEMQQKAEAKASS